MATGAEPRILPISGLDHPNVLSYIYVLRQDANVGHRVTIIGVRGVGFDTKRWVEYWGVEGTNEARAGASATVPSQRHKGCPPLFHRFLPTLPTPPLSPPN